MPPGAARSGCARRPARAGTAVAAAARATTKVNARTLRARALTRDELSRHRRPLVEGPAPAPDQGAAQLALQIFCWMPQLLDCEGRSRPDESVPCELSALPPSSPTTRNATFPAGGAPVQVPADPIADRPFGYRPVKDDPHGRGYVLYSLWLDQADQGGRMGPDGPEIGFPDEDQGTDLVLNQPREPRSPVDRR